MVSSLKLFIQYTVTNTVRNSHPHLMYSKLFELGGIYDNSRVATYHPIQNSLLFPDFPLIFYRFPYPLTDKKKSFLFFTLMVLTASLHIWRLLLKGRICSPRELILSFKSSPQCSGRWASTISWECTSFPLLNRINKFSEDCLP